MTWSEWETTPDLLSPTDSLPKEFLDSISFSPCCGEKVMSATEGNVIIGRCKSCRRRSFEYDAITNKLRRAIFS